MTGGPANNDGLLEEINIVPLVDIVLVLLIIFLLTANFMDQPALRVNLPRTAASDGPVPGTFSVTVDAEDRLYLNGGAVTLAEISARLRELPGGPSQATVLIQGDRSASHGRVTELMGALKAEGVTKFAINLDPSAAPAERHP